MRSAIPSAPSTRRRAFCAVSLLLVTLFFSDTAARLSDDVYAEDDSVTQRVARISYLQGSVWIRRAGASDWEDATLNLPLVEGDRLATGDDARLEIQLDRDNFIRLDRDATLNLTTLRPEGIALSLTEGTLALRLARFLPEKEFFEIDLPGATVACEQKGYYRLDAPPAGSVRLAVREGGRARLYAEQDAFTVRAERAVERDDAAQGEWSFSNAAPFDYWDAWSGERDILIARRINEREERFDAQDVWGAEELDDYGDWSHTQDYGWVWRPRVTAINNYNDWAPYRYGRWRWCPPYGWTWVGDEPWGWAPYHYGRWVYQDNNWCWTPRFYGYRPQVRARWRPALVVFVLLNRQRDSHVAWYPLDYRQPYRHHHPWRRDDGRRGDGRRGDRRDRVAPLRPEEVARLERRNPGRLRGVTELPAREFGRRGARARAADRDAARQVLASEPVREGLPIVPAGIDVAGLRTRPRADDANGVRASRPERDDRQGGMRNRDLRGGRAGVETGRETARAEGGDDLIVAARQPVALPTRTVEERPTGVARRESGSPLGELLRRARTRENRRTMRPRGEDEGADLSGERPRNERPRGERPRNDASPDARTDAASSGVTAPPAVVAQPEAGPSREGIERQDERRERRERNRNLGTRQGDIFARPEVGNDDAAGRENRSDDDRERVRPERPSRRERNDDANARPSRRESARPPASEEAPRAEEPRPERTREERREERRDERREERQRAEQPRTDEPRRERAEPPSEERQERPQRQEQSAPEQRRERAPDAPRVNRKVAPID